MDKQKIAEQLQSSYGAFISCVQSLNEREFNAAPDGKWNAGQTLDHLNRAVSAVSQALRIPKFVFAVLFGSARRLSKDYDVVVASYQAKLAAGSKASGRYLPHSISFGNQQKKELAMQESVNRLCKSLDHYSEIQLDQYILPHPILGKITMREMLYFTIYHADHHRKIVVRDSKIS
jgi:hypothetical protein